MGRRVRGTGRRLLLVGAVLLPLGGLVAITQISSAETAAQTADGQGGAQAQPSASPDAGLGNSCATSRLPAHTGFQDGDRCVSTAFGEVGLAEKNPTLLIVEAPETVEVGQPFALTVSTRNLVRDRFLPAAQGGYYLESSFLTEDGLVRGHFHTACRILTRTDEAPEPAPAPAFFVATEDSRGGAEPDTVTIQVPGLPEEGIAQCAVWAGDGSHRIPMMQRANQIPALDAVRIRVTSARQPAAQESPTPQPPAPATSAQPAPAQQRPTPHRTAAQGSSGDRAPRQSGERAATDQSPSGAPATAPTVAERVSPSEGARREDASAREPSNRADASSEAPRSAVSPESADKDDDAPTDATAPSAAELPVTETSDPVLVADTAAQQAADRLALTGARSFALAAAGGAIAVVGVVVILLGRRGRYRGTRY